MSERYLVSGDPLLPPLAPGELDSRLRAFLASLPGPGSRHWAAARWAAPPAPVPDPEVTFEPPNADTLRRARAALETEPASRLPVAVSPRVHDAITSRRGPVPPLK